MHKSPSLWRKVLRGNFVNISVLADFLELSPAQRKELLSNPKFPLNLPMRLAQKIVKGTLDDPILKQFLPTTKENVKTADFLLDPVGDENSCKTSKMLHKYFGRVLLLCTSACAMHCRYCFRQHFSYDTSEKIFENELKLIAEDESISEVILSGGDPLSLDNRVLEDLFQRLEKIPHLRKVRFHTRFPIGIPERIDEHFLEILGKSPLQVWFIIHANHPREFDNDIFAALKSIQRLGIPVLNHAVLLKGINDSVEVLAELCNTLVDHGIIPYYLNQLDRAQGTAHFEVSQAKGKQLMTALATRLPGYAVPRYAIEIPGEPGKTIINLY